jgi:exopolyphosphatase / guanosine-5'-triphosphate,3'-diphosphate pyrophosphatase
MNSKTHSKNMNKKDMNENTDTDESIDKNIDENIIEKIAAIDIGTNSIHIVVVDVNSKGLVTVISRTKEMVRLGEKNLENISDGEMKSLSTEAMQRGIDTLKRFALLANNHNAKIRAIATSAVREAENNIEFIDMVKEKTGIDIEIVSGVEEGRLAYLGVLYGVPIFEKKTLVIDIGGGSTETVIGKQGDILYSNSEKIGTIRLTQNFFSKEITSVTITKCRQYIAGKLAHVFNAIDIHGLDEVVGTAGTIETIAFMAYLKKNKEIPEVVNGLSISINGMLEIIEKIVNAATPQAISKLNGMDVKRADIILAGALIIEYILQNLQKNLGVKKILFSAYGLREGILYDTIQKNDIFHRFSKQSELRKNTIENLAKKFNVVMNHSKHVQMISLKIFDALQDKLPDFGSYEKELLSYSALLHDIGYFISHDLHHKHSLYLIENSDLPGFTNDEAKLMANIARYHRKSHPKKSHSNYAVLSEKKKYIVKVLAGILSIAEGIDRRQSQLVKDIITNYDFSTNTLSIQLIPADKNIIPEIEHWGASMRYLLLSETLKIEIDISIL